MRNICARDTFFFTYIYIHKNVSYKAPYVLVMCKYVLFQSNNKRSTASRTNKEPYFPFNIPTMEDFFLDIVPLALVSLRFILILAYNNVREREFFYASYFRA